MREIQKQPLTTVYESELDTVQPWSEYPRPQLKRDSFVCLNGSWDFTVTKNAEKPKCFDSKILVPFPPESPLSKIECGIDKGEYMHYRTTFQAPPRNKGEMVKLHFGAVDQICHVYVNDRKAISHQGGYLPFSVDITDLIGESTNELYITVKDDLDLSLPYGKQKVKRGGMWYTPVSGIWQTVWLEVVPEGYIEDIKITPTLESVKIEVITTAKNKTLTLTDSGESYTFTDRSVTVKPKELKHWTPETPFLYRFKVETDTDKIESYFALREITIRKVNGLERLCLNGKPYLFNGLLDQGYFPDGIFLPATANGYRDDILLAKALGFNTLRKHIKIEPDIFYYLCDSLGIAVFQDMVNNSDYNFIRDTALPTVGLKKRSDKRLHKDPEERKIFLQHTKDTLAHLYNFPSIVYYTIFNEGWGQFCADEAYNLVKSTDPTRIVDSTSGWFKENLSDVESEHIYFKKIKLGDPSDRPVVISEFGGYSLRIDGHLYGNGNYGYKSFSSEDEFEQAVARLYLEEVAPLIDEGISGLIYTQLSDVEDETNGFVTYDRKKVKVNPERIRGVMEFLAKKIK